MLLLSGNGQQLLAPAGMGFGFHHSWHEMRLVWARIHSALQDKEFLKTWEDIQEGLAEEIRSKQTGKGGKSSKSGQLLGMDVSDDGG